MKKIIALVLALAMVLMVGASFAEGFNNLTKDTSISISKLEAGDTVAFYRVLKFSEDAKLTGGWVADNGFTLDNATIQKMLGLGADGKPASDLATNAANYGISATLAGTIGDMAESATAKYTGSTTPKVEYTDTTDAEGKVTSRTATVTGVDDGLYIAIVTPGVPGTVYNPVFVGADYKTNETNTWAVDMDDTYSPASMAKKGVITLEKTAATTENTWDDQKPETAAVGDTITFTVKTKIPEFADNYTNPKFFITDTLDDGLDFDTGSVTIVKPATITSSDYSITDKDNKRGFVLNFTETYLKDLDAVTEVEITYTAKVNTEANYNVNEFDNNVTVNFSNHPEDGEGHGILKDKTKHYTFSIDALLNGNVGYHCSEVVKVGLDKNGKELTNTKELSNTYAVGALQNAEFKLYTAEACADSDLYSDATYTTDDYGHITIKGLDAGTYYLKETKAPDGYIKAQDAVKVEIIAEIENQTYTETIDNQTVTYTVPELKSYEVKIAGKKTATATLTNNKDGITELTWEEFTGKFGLIGSEGEGDKTVGKIENTQGVELPSTGGIGTTIFYILGGLLVVGAAVILVARRKASN